MAIHMGDVGTVVELTVKDNGTVVDISTATALTIKFKKPSGTTVTQTAVFSTDGTDGKLKYTFQSGDLDETGTWEFQGNITSPSGSWNTEVSSFSVAKNI